MRRDLMHRRQRGRRHCDRGSHRDAAGQSPHAGRDRSVLGNTNLIAASVRRASPTCARLHLTPHAEREVLAGAAHDPGRGAGRAGQYGFFVGAIAIVRAIQLARRVLHPLGVNHGIGNAAALGLGASQVLFGGAEGLLSGIPAEIGFDEEPMRRDDYAALMVTTLERMIFGALPFWGEELEPMRSTLVRAPVDRPLRSLLPLLRGRPSARMLRHGYEATRASHPHRLQWPPRDRWRNPEARSERPIILSDGGIAEFSIAGMNEPRAEILDVIHAESERPVPDSARLWPRRCGGGTGRGGAVLFYGSCLRSGRPRQPAGPLPAGGPVSRRLSRTGTDSLANRILPPNVFYFEMPWDGRPIRGRNAR
jgi:hypothetical protein